ncbi:MAG: hypothetical protein ABW208_21500 [Pyrinomonadaceae bacterium]
MSEEEVPLWLYSDADDIAIGRTYRHSDLIDFYLAVVITADEVSLIIVDSGASMNPLGLTLEDVKRCSILTQPRSIFKDEGAISGWADDIVNSFAPNLERALRQEAASHLLALARFYLERRGAPGHTGQQIFNEYLSNVGRRMRNFLSLVGPHGEVSGNKKSLTNLARQALRTAPEFKLQRDYYEHINSYALKNHPRLASNSGEALRKRFGRLGIDLKVLISESNKFRGHRVLISKKLGKVISKSGGGKL